MQTSMKNKEKRDPEVLRERVSKYVQEYFVNKSIFPNLQNMATAGNRFGLSLSRQTIHNWATGQTLPLLTLLESYILILQLRARDYEDVEPQGDTLETKEEVWRSMAIREKLELTELTNFFMAIRDIVNGN